jgi:type I restriction enzyme M protein
MDRGQRCYKLYDANIADIYKLFKNSSDIEHIIKLIEKSKIVEQDYYLSVSTYVEAEDIRENVNIISLNTKIASIVANVDRLRNSIAEIEGSNDRVD